MEKHDVLIVDDDEPIRNLLRSALRRVGVSCGVAIDGVEAVERMERAAYGLVLLDLMMPRLDGFGFVEHLRAWERKHEFRPLVLVMTAAPESAEAQLVKVGDMVQAVIPKPFNVWDVADLVQECVNVQRAHEMIAVPPFKPGR